ncbi:hypothetical protein D3C75_1006780 [compost metagenome]
MALPKGWIGLLNEVYSALHSNSRRLAMMGARALVDVYMNDTVSDVGGFEQKLKALVVQGHISANDKDVLAAALEAGHAAAHRGHVASESEVNHVMDIVESLLQKHALKISAAELKKGIPGRDRPKK